MTRYTAAAPAPYCVGCQLHLVPDPGDTCPVCAPAAPVVAAAPPSPPPRGLAARTLQALTRGARR